MPIKTIKKRNGQKVKFDKTKVSEAIWKAASEVGGHDPAKAEILVEFVVDYLIQKNNIAELTTENVGNAVEKVLIERGHAKTAKAFILYRDQKRRVREMKTTVGTEVIKNYLDEVDWRVKENANCSYSAQGLNAHISGAVIAKYWLTEIYPKQIADAHSSGDFHLHDLGSGLMAYCCGWDLHALLLEGYGGVPGQTSCHPPKYLRSALGQLVAFLFSVQQDVAGAVAVSSFDTLLAPFVHKEKLSYESVKQCVQEFVFQVNMSGRTGMQRPFTNVTLDFVVPGHMKGMPATVGGKPYGVYGDFQKEADMVSKALIEVLYDGDGAGQPFSFPIPTVNITKDFDWTSDGAKMLMKATAKYGPAYFANFIHSDMKPEDVRSFCCRLTLDVRELRSKGGGLFGAHPLTGSIGVVTLNMPRIAYLAKSKEEFFEKIQHLVNLAVKSLNIKREMVESYTNQGLHPFARRWLKNVKRARGSYWGNHFGTVGIVGMNEACLNASFIKQGIDSAEGKAFAKETLHYMRSILTAHQQEHNLMYNLEATPAEGTSHRLARIDKQKYPDIIVANEGSGKAPYYTNSVHLPVGHTKDLFEALDHQGDMLGLFTGGSVLHGFIGEKQPDPDACASLIRKAFNKYTLPYMSITPTYSVCHNDGYHYGEHFTCPKCGAECDVYSRVVGYYRPVRNWNEGKKAEYHDRRIYSNI